MAEVIPLPLIVSMVNEISVDPVRWVFATVTVCDFANVEVVDNCTTYSTAMLNPPVATEVKWNDACWLICALFCGSTRPGGLSGVAKPLAGDRELKK